MGGAAGHIKHVWEITEFTFNDLYDLIIKSLNGEIYNAKEKLDGQNIMVTVRNGEVVTSRSTKHLKNFGDNALNKEQLYNYFTERGTPDFVRDSYIKAVTDFQDALNIVDKDNKMCLNGKIWINAEILYKHNPNIIPYGVNQLRLHHLRELDENGKTISVNPVPNYFANRLKTMIIPSTYDILVTNDVEVEPPVLNYMVQDYLLTMLRSYKDEALILSKKTIGDFMVNKFKIFIDKNIYVKKETKNILANRWGKGEKSVRINSLLKNESQTNIDWIKEQDKNISAKYKEFIYPIEKVISLLGVAALQRVENRICKNKTVVNDIEKEYKNAISKFEKNKDKLDDKTRNELELQIKKFNDFGGTLSINPIEGIVFDFRGHTIKLSGSFIPLLRIIGWYQFS